MTAQTYTAIIHRQNGGYAAECPEAGTTSVGATIEAALTNLKLLTEHNLSGMQLVSVEAPLVTTFAVGDIAGSFTSGKDDEAIISDTTSQAIPMTGEALLASGLVGIWADRTDMGDTIEFARKLRERAQRREHE